MVITITIPMQTQTFPQNGRLAASGSGTFPTVTMHSGDQLNISAIYDHPLVIPEPGSFFIHLNYQQFTRFGSDILDYPYDHPDTLDPNGFTFHANLRYWYGAPIDTPINLDTLRFEINAAPEPATWVLMIFGFVLLMKGAHRWTWH